MKFTLLLLAGATVFGASLYADSIPEDLKAKIEAKSKEVKPGDESAQNSWVSLQCSAWENIQYITSSLPKEELDAIKKMAEEKFPENGSSAATDTGRPGKENLWRISGSIPTRSQPKNWKGSAFRKSRLLPS